MTGQTPKQNPPHIPPGLPVRYSLLTVMLVATALSCCVCCPLWTIQHLQGYSTLATYRGPQGRDVKISYPNLQEMSRVFSIQVREHGENIKGTLLHVSMDESVSRKDFEVVWLDDGDLVAVYSCHSHKYDRGAWTPLLTHRFSTNETFSEDKQMPPTLAQNVELEFKRQHPSD